MNINNNRLMDLPTVDRKASRWKIPHKHLTTYREAGDILPIFDFEVLPGDVISVDYNAVFTRMTTPIFPVMDDCYLDLYYFYVPFRIMYEKFPEFLGAKPDGYGIQENEYFIPSVYNVIYTNDDIGSYMTNVNGVKIVEPISTMYFKAYAMIYNEWFRDENLTQPYEVKKSYESLDYDNAVLSDVSKLQYGIGIAKASKLHDLFTSALPFTQKGPAVSFSFDDDLPLRKIDTLNSDLNLTDIDNVEDGVLRYWSAAENSWPISLFPGSNAGLDRSIRSVKQYNDASTASDVALYLKNVGVTPNISFSVNELRTAFQMQRYYEALARSGTRYNEFIKGIFGVDIKDETIQRPIRLGSARYNISMHQVVQTSSTDAVSPKGSVSGISTDFMDASNIFKYSFREAGVILGLVVIRTNNTYPRSLPRHYSHLKKFDFYIPQLQAIGEQAILNKEIFYKGDKDKDNEVFGYQEAWYEYRYKPSKVTGNFSDENTQSAYAPWTYATYFSDTPVLNDTFIKETGDNVDRTLAVQNGPQFLLDYKIVLDVTRLMPLYSVPGLMDHY